MIEGQKVWRPMHRGVADRPRRADVSGKANGRYLDAMAAVDTPLTLRALTDRLDQPVAWGKGRVRGLNLLGRDAPTKQETTGHH